MSWQTQFVGESCYFDLDDCADNDVSGYIGLKTFSDLQVRYAVTPKATVFAGWPWSGDWSRVWASSRTRWRP